jgi:hypothetical protein
MVLLRLIGSGRVPINGSARSSPIMLASAVGCRRSTASRCSGALFRYPVLDRDHRQLSVVEFDRSASWRFDCPLDQQPIV